MCVIHLPNQVKEFANRSLPRFLLVIEFISDVNQSLCNRVPHNSLNQQILIIILLFHKIEGSFVRGFLLYSYDTFELALY